MNLYYVQQMHLWKEVNPLQTLAKESNHKIIMVFHNFNSLPKQYKEKYIQSKYFLIYRPSHHLDLSKSKTQKINNLNTIYYNKD